MGEARTPFLTPSPTTNMDLVQPTNTEVLGEDAATLAIMSQATQLQPGLNARSRSIAIGLRDSLDPIVRKVVGAGGRPAALSRGLEIDRTLAARVLRAIRA